MSMHLVISVYFILVHQLSLLKSERVERGETFPSTGVNCIVCREMFNVDFDYDLLMKDKTAVEGIKNEIRPGLGAGVESVDDRLIENTAKEVSMQYFFKGGEAQFGGDLPVLNSCKSGNYIGSTCGDLKIKLCEGILSLDLGENCKLSISNRSIMSRLSGIINTKQSDPGQDPNTLSFFQLTPDYISQNFDSAPKSHWKPPKPVLLQNFETSIGEQLKDISQLTSEIAKYEKKLNELKQQLANKLEVAQSSYTVIQKTLQQISMMVNKPNLPQLIKSPSQFTEDDWDESAKAKFLN